MESKLDPFKLIVAIGMVLAAVGAFYWYADQSLLYRVLGLLAVVGVAAAIAATTASGRAFLSFAKDSRNEVRKVVWPTRQETIQTTLMVLFMVILVGIFLWLLDMGLGAVVKSLTGQGG